MPGFINKPEHGSLEWLNVRHRDQYGRVRFGASEAPTLMRCNPFSTLSDLAISKWSEPVVGEPNAAMQRGTLLEPALLTYAAQVLGCEVVVPDEMYFVGRLIATLDGVSHDDQVIVECKTTTAYSSDDPLPESYYWQAVAQMACTGHDMVLVVVLDKYMRLGSWTVRRNMDDVDRLFARADEIGRMLDDKQLPPDAPLNERTVKALYPSAEGTMELGSTGLFIVNAWQAAVEARKQAEAEEQQWRDQLAALLGGAEAGAVDGRVVLTYKSRKTGTTFDSKRFAAEHPELAAQYTKPSATTRVLLARS
jgi:hypothetical protein